MKTLGEKGQTHGKEQGTGLGLYHARNSVENWGGSLQIESAVREGTVLTLTLPKTEVPPWFMPEITLSSNMEVIILDDDLSIHQVWQGRFLALSSKLNHFQIHHFSTSADLLEWWGKTNRAGVSRLFLIDFELLGGHETGIDLIEKMGVQAEGILVTSRFEETTLRTQCVSLGFKLIPKNLAAFIPIGVPAKKYPLPCN